MHKTAHTDSNFKKKFAYFALKLFIESIVFWIYNSGLLTAPFKIIPQDIQWILGLLTPLPKLLFIKLYLKICSKVYGSIAHSVKITVVHYLQINHALFLVLTMGYTATPATTYVILIVDFVMNLYNGLKIVYKYKKGYPSLEGRSNIKC